MPNCSVATCTSHNKMKGATDIKFYGFPKNKDLAIQWAQACKRSDKINMKYGKLDNYYRSVVVPKHLFIFYFSYYLF